MRPSAQRRTSSEGEVAEVSEAGCSKPRASVRWTGGLDGERWWLAGTAAVTQSVTATRQHVRATVSRRTPQDADPQALRAGASQRDCVMCV